MGNEEELISSIKIKKKGTYTFSLSQVGKRMFSEDSKYEYSAAKIIVFKNGDGEDFTEELTFVKGVQAYGDRDLHLEVDLD
jgi:hypothetical protein